MKKLSVEEIKFLNSIVLDRKISDRVANTLSKRIGDGNITPRQYMLELFLSSNFTKFATERATEFHLYFIHHARIKLVSTMRPKLTPYLI